MEGGPIQGNMVDEKKHYTRNCIATLIYTLFIFATLPVFPTVWGFLNRLSPSFFKGLTSAFIPLSVLLFFFYFVFVKKEKSRLFYLWSTVFALSYGPLVYFYCEFPAERLHVVEYGLLVAFAYHCLKVRIRTLWIYSAIILYAFFVGVVDEIIQGILPNRVYEFKDVIINWASSFLAAGLLAGITWQGFAGKTQNRMLERWSMVIIFVMVAGNVALLYKKYWRPPLNVILLTVDTFRPDHLSCYGYHRDTTPFLDTVARRGVIFKNVISSAPWTTPGMISVFTGLYPPAHGVQARGHYLLPETPTIFKVFRKHGFKVPNLSYLTDIVNFSNLGLEPTPSLSIIMEARAAPDFLLACWLSLAIRLLSSARR